MASKKISKTKISRKRKQPKEISSTFRGIATKTRVGDDPPSDREGKEGEITIRMVDGVIKLYAKFRRKWYSVDIS